MENKIERAVILCENNKITIADLDLETITAYEENPYDIQPFLLMKAEYHLNFLRKPLLKNNNNISKTAEELGLSRGSLYRRLEKYNINLKTDSL